MGTPEQTAVTIAAGDQVFQSKGVAMPHAAPTAPLSTTAPPSAAHRLAAVPFRWIRVGLYAAAIPFAIAVLGAQAALMSMDVVVEGYYYNVAVKGSDVATAPGLPLAVAVLSLVLAIALLVLILVLPALFLTLWLTITEVSLVTIITVLWIASLGVSGKTASDIGSGTDLAGANGAALAFEVLSLPIWIGILVLGIIALVKMVQALPRAARPPPAAPATWLQP